MLRPFSEAALLAAVLLGTACAQTVVQAPTGEVVPNFLQLAAFSLVDSEAGTLEGFLKWTYVADDPALYESPREDCQLWEHLSLSSASVDPTSCEGCSELFEGQAEVDAESTTCASPSWSERPFALAFSVLSDDVELEELYGADGYTHRVFARWKPDTGTADSFAPLLVAKPGQWAPESGDAGTGEGVALDGQHVHEGLYYWDMR